MAFNKVKNDVPFWQKITVRDVSRFLHICCDCVDTYEELRNRPPKSVENDTVNDNGGNE